MSIAILSWNTRNTSIKKLLIDGAPSGFGDFVAALISYTTADVVGLMEMRDGQGSTLGPILARVQAVLPNGNWQGVTSAQQDDTTRRETSIFLYSSATVTPDASKYPGPFFSPNVVDSNALQNIDILAGASSNTQLATNIQNWLNTNFCYTPGKLLRLSVAAANALLPLNAPPANFSPPAPTNIPANYNGAWFQTLRGIDYLWFPQMADRPPFIGQFVTVADNTPFATAVFHAPNPTDRGVGSSANIIAQSVVLQAATNVLVMGDFNITRNAMAEECACYSLTSTGWKVTSGTTATPFSALEAVCGITWVDSPLTSISTHCPAAASTDTTAALSKAYDTFFCKSATDDVDYQLIDLFHIIGKGTISERDLMLQALKTLCSVVATANTTWDEWIQAKVNAKTALYNRATTAMNNKQTIWNAVVNSASPQQKATTLYQQRLDAAETRYKLAEAAQQDFANQVKAYTSLLDVVQTQDPAKLTLQNLWVVLWRGVSDHLPILATWEL